MDSDSDSDLEVFRSMVHAKTNKQPKNEDYQQKIGENAILRARLDRIEAENQQAMQQLIYRQEQLDKAHELELQKLRTLYEAERSLHLQLQGDQLLNGKRHTPNKFNKPPSKRRAELSDGFEIAPKVKNSSGVLDTADLLQFLLAHRTPGFPSLTIQVLFGISHPSNTSIGHYLMQTQTLDELCSKLITLILEADFTTDLRTLYLTLLYDSQFCNLGINVESLESVPKELCELLMLWLDSIKPLPAFKALDAMALVCLQDIRVLTHTIYALDVLLARQWRFQLPLELSVRLLECVQVPQIRARAYDLFAKYPRAELHNTAFYKFLHTVPEPKMELLFLGLRDPQPLTAAELALYAPENSGYARLCSSLRELPLVCEKAKANAHLVFTYSLRASVRMAYALLPVAPSMAPADRHVLGLLKTVHPNDLELSKVCVFYFWRRAALRETLSAADMRDLLLCLAKIVQCNQSEQIKSQATDLITDHGAAVGLPAPVLAELFAL